MNKALFSSDVEKNQHESALLLLCEEFPTQSRQVIELYENELAAIITEATIRSYLPIFISRKVREVIGAQNQRPH